MTSQRSAPQFRASAIALILIAALTAAMIAAQWLVKFDGPLLIPVVLAYFLFNFGYLFALIKGHFLTRGERIGAGAVTMNLLAMLFADFNAIWTVLSLCAIIAALIGAALLFKEAKVAVVVAE